MAKNKRNSRVSFHLRAVDALGKALTDHGHKWSERERRLYENSTELLTRKIKNTNHVPKNQWRKWTPTGQDTFNEVFWMMYQNSHVFDHPDMTLKPADMPKDHWKTVCWNAAWVAAGAATE